MTEKPEKEDSFSSSEAQEGRQLEGQEKEESISKTEGSVSSRSHPAHGSWLKVLRRKRIIIPFAILILLAVLVAIPYTRYALAGLVLKQDFSVQVVDSETQKPVSNANVMLADTLQKTDSNGKVTMRVKVGSTTLSVSKKYYQSTDESVLIPIFKQAGVMSVSIKATGRQVPITITNKVSGKPVANITIQAVGTEVTTAADGKAVLVLPADRQTVAATLSGSGFNTEQATIKVTTDEGANSLTIVPSGKVYFLSNLNGTLDVVKTDLDGSNRQTVLAGTGREDGPNTVLLASKDWRYLALYSKRDGGDYAKLFLIETATGNVNTIDDSKSDFTFAGWYDDRYFVYVADHADVSNWQPKKQTLMSYDAISKAPIMLDSTLGIGDSETKYLRETMGTPYGVNDEVVIAKSLIMGSYGLGPDLHKSAATVVGVMPDGTNKHTIKSFSAGPGVDITEVFISLSLFKPGDLYIQYTPQYQAGLTENWEYEGGAVSQVSTNTSTYTTYLESPSGQQTLWVQPQDGKYSIYVGDQSGSNGKEILPASDYQVYGWFTKDYILLSKSGSELFIMPAAGLTSGQLPTKVTDYYKQPFGLSAYNNVYGGF